MKYSTCVFSLLFLLFSNVVSAGLVSWPSQTFSRSRYISGSEGPNIRVIDLEPERSILKIHGVRFTPENARPGDELTIEVAGYLYEAVYGSAIVEVEIIVGSEAPIERKYDLCNELWNNREHAPLQCPIEEGDLTFTQKVTLGENIPEDLIHVKVKAYNNYQASLAHFVIVADFRSYNFNDYLH